MKRINIITNFLIVVSNEETSDDDLKEKDEKADAIIYEQEYSLI